MYKMRYETNSRSVEASEENRERERENCHVTRPCLQIQ